jgi:uncharacterized delta-60 repeat protein
VRYFADDVDLGQVNFAPTIPSSRLVSGSLEMFGSIDPLTTPYHYDPADYTAFFDDYSIVSVPLSPVNAVIEFASTNILADEFMPTARVNVTRRGFISAAARVLVSTTNDTAVAGEDYQAVSTFVTFAAGETNKVVEIPLLDDYWAEPDKTFLVRISGLPPGATSGQPVARIFIRDDERPGSIDSTWATTLGAPPLDPGQRMSSYPFVQPDGKILVALIRENAAFVRIDQRVVRINPDGSLDPTFTQIPIAFGNGITLSLMPDGKIIIGQQQSAASGFAKRLKRFNSNGTEDATLTATVEGSAPGPWVVGLPAGKMILIRDHYADAANRVNGSAVPDLVRLNTDGSRDATFAAPSGLAFYFYGQIGQEPVRVLSNGKILLGTESTRPVYRLNENGSIDPSFTVTRATLSPEINTFPVVGSLLTLADGKIIVGGYFETFNGRSQVGIVRLNPDGTIDDSFHSELGFVNSIHLLPNGQMLVNYAGDSGSSTALLNPDGTRDPAFEPALIPHWFPPISEPLHADVLAIADGQPIFDNRYGLGRLRLNLPLRIVTATHDTNGTTHLLANALPDRSYTLQTSETLTNWTELATQPATTNRIEFTDAPDPAPAQRFYRVKEDCALSSPTTRLGPGGTANLAVPGGNLRPSSPLRQSASRRRVGARDMRTKWSLPDAPEAADGSPAATVARSTRTSVESFRLKTRNSRREEAHFKLGIRD